jgi:metal-responsive CopG/Arc/MetJ family transcriptional regulator
VPNVLRVPRPNGSGRPNKNRVLTSVWLSANGMAELDRIADQHNVKRSDVIRLALKHGLTLAEADLKRNASGGRGS